MLPIGYYVHHHGDGHRQRALAIAATQPERFVLLGTGLAGRTGPIDAIELADDRIVGCSFDGLDNEIHRPNAFHYAPLKHDGVRARMGAIASWIATDRPSLIFVDVSVEIALLARLCATPVAYIRLSGRRNDPPHFEAFRAANVLVAPFAEPLDDPQTPGWIRRKTLYAPGIVPRFAKSCPQRGRILVVVGHGGSSIVAANVLAAARATPDHSWRVIGLRPPDTPTANVTFVEWSNDPQGEVARAEIVIGGAGDGLVGAVMAAKRPFICIPEPRPFDEQIAKAIALGALGAAVVRDRWPAQDEWTDLLAAARALKLSRQEALDDRNGAENLMRALRQIVDC